MERCPKVPTDPPWTDPPRCHVEKPLDDGRLHLCELNVSHHGLHMCYCEREYK